MPLERPGTLASWLVATTPGQYVVATLIYAVAAIGTVTLRDPFVVRFPFALFFAAVQLTALLTSFALALGVAVAGSITFALQIAGPGSGSLVLLAMVAGIAVFMAYLIDRRSSGRRQLADAQAAVRAIQALLHGVLQQLPLGVVIADAADSRVVFANEAAARMLGRESGVEDHSSHGVHADPRRYGPDEPLARALTGETVTEDIEWVCPDAARRVLRVRAAPIRDAAGQRSAALALLEDVTDRRLVEQQSRQSQRLESVGQLAGGVAHDFNNLLTVIVGNAALALETLDGHPAGEQLDEIARCAQRAAELTRQLLAFSRRQLVQPRVLDINAMVPSLVKMLRRLLGEHIELLTRLDPQLGHIQADAGQLEQVIINLAVNARDAMPHGGRLTIETRNVDASDNPADAAASASDAHPYVMLAVSDTGIGMDRETQTRIFEPFFTTKAFGKGTGLGLATVFGIVSQSGGHIWVDSEPGRGTTFKVYLPRVDAPVVATVAHSAEPADAKKAETVLLVEDEQGVRKLVRSVLTLRGYAVMECQNADEALFMSDSYPGPIHLVITDVVMPGKSGRVLAGQLLERRHGLKVLYMSGYTDDAIMHHGAIDPDVSFLEKPFTPDALLHKVRQVLDQP